MSEVKTLATLVLGGFFDHDELGDIDIHYSMGNVEALQERLVTSVDDVHVELVSRIDYDAAQSELAALREELATFDEGMREIAFVLGAGGYNAESLSASQLVEKVKWGLEHHASVQEQRLTAAEQRNTELQGLLTVWMFGYETGTLGPGHSNIYARTMTALKPTESGASE